MNSDTHPPEDATLDWSGRGLSSIPETEHAAAVCAVHINLEGNALSSFPECIAASDTVESCSLRGNELSTIDADVFSSTWSKTIRTLDLSRNKITSLPKAFAKLLALERLDLSYNRLSIVPHSVGALPSLRQLNLCGNRLSGCLDECLGNLKHLEVLDVSYNQISLVPPSVRSLTQLRSLNLAFNALNYEGALPLDVLRGMPVFDDVCLTGNPHVFPFGVEQPRDKCWKVESGVAKSVGSANGEAMHDASSGSDAPKSAAGNGHIEVAQGSRISENGDGEHSAGKLPKDDADERRRRENKVKESKKKRKKRRRAKDDKKRAEADGEERPRRKFGSSIEMETSRSANDVREGNGDDEGEEGTKMSKTRSIGLSLSRSVSAVFSRHSIVHSDSSDSVSSGRNFLVSPRGMRDSPRVRVQPDLKQSKSATVVDTSDAKKRGKSQRKVRTGLYGSPPASPPSNRRKKAPPPLRLDKPPSRGSSRSSSRETTPVTTPRSAPVSPRSVFLSIELPPEIHLKPEARPVVTSAPLDQLWRLLVNEHGSDREYEAAFLASFPEFQTPEELIRCLIAYAEGGDESSISRVMALLLRWVHAYRSDFGEREIELVQEFLVGVEDIGECRKVVALIRSHFEGKEKSMHRKSSALPPRVLVPMDHLMTPPTSVLHIHSREAARQLMLINYELFTAIDVRELLGLGWTKPDSAARVPTLQRMIDRFNLESQWAASAVMCGTTAQDRAKLIGRLCRIAALSNEMGNMSSAMAIFSGLQTAAVQRLQETWINLDLQSWKYMNSLVAQFCMDGNYAAARQDIAKRSAPFIPFVGIYLHDLTFIAEGNPLMLENGNVNFEREAMVATIVNRVRAFQDGVVRYSQVDTIRTFFESISGVDENEMYKASLACEPRGMTLKRKKTRRATILGQVTRGLRGEDLDEAELKEISTLLSKDQAGDDDAGDIEDEDSSVPRSLLSLISPSQSASSSPRTSPRGPRKDTLLGGPALQRRLEELSNESLMHTRSEPFMETSAPPVGSRASLQSLAPPMLYEQTTYEDGTLCTGSEPSTLDGDTSPMKVSATELTETVEEDSDTSDDADTDDTGSSYTDSEDHTAGLAVPAPPVGSRRSFRSLAPPVAADGDAPTAVSTFNAPALSMRLSAIGEASRQQTDTANDMTQTEASDDDDDDDYDEDDDEPRRAVHELLPPVSDDGSVEPRSAADGVSKPLEGRSLALLKFARQEDLTDTANDMTETGGTSDDEDDCQE